MSNWDLLCIMSDLYNIDNLSKDDRIRVLCELTYSDNRLGDKMPEVFEIIPTPRELIVLNVLGYTTKKETRAMLEFFCNPVECSVCLLSSRGHYIH